MSRKQVSERFIHNEYGNGQQDGQKLVSGEEIAQVAELVSNCPQRVQEMRQQFGKDAISIAQASIGIRKLTGHDGRDAKPFYEEPVYREFEGHGRAEDVDRQKVYDPDDLLEVLLGSQLSYTTIRFKRRGGLFVPTYNNGEKPSTIYRSISRALGTNALSDLSEFRPILWRGTQSEIDDYLAAHSGEYVSL